jgi:dTDP-4-dehydrorhamnose 3,5-epimerase
MHILQSNDTVKPDMAKPLLLQGGLVVDERGQLGFVNDFNMAGVRRFYWVSNHKAGFVRAWHAHRKETKYFTVVNGEALIGAVEIDDWENPSKDCKTWRYVVSAEKPSILYIPPGFANGFMSLTEDARLIVFSTSSFEESLKDDVRYPARFWDVWNIVER